MTQWHNWGTDVNCPTCIICSTISLPQKRVWVNLLNSVCSLKQPKSFNTATMKEFFQNITKNYEKYGNSKPLRNDCTLALQKMATDDKAFICVDSDKSVLMNLMMMSKTIWKCFCTFSTYDRIFVLVSFTWWLPICHLASIWWWWYWWKYWKWSEGGFYWYCS